MRTMKPYMKIQNKKTKQIKYFTRRDEFIYFIISENKEANVKDSKHLYTLSKEQLLEKYLSDWFDIRGIE